MSERPRWDEDGANWPNAAASRTVSAAGIRWHVQRMGSGPVALLLHGTGGATHSWRDLMPLLAARFTVIAPDLPGHGFTEMPATRKGLSLSGMAAGVRDLLTALEARPQLVVGHSAGAALGLRMCLDGTLDPDLMVSLNGAVMPLQGAAWPFFAPIAQLVTAGPLLPRLFAWRIDRNPAMVKDIIGKSGSTLDAKGLACYYRVARKPRHVAAALGMMAGWDLPGLKRDLPMLNTPLLQLIGAEDRTIPPKDAQRLKEVLKRAPVTLITMPGLGHLAHEEAPEATAAAILQHAARDGLLAA